MTELNTEEKNKYKEDDQQETHNHERQDVESNHVNTLLCVGFNELPTFLFSLEYIILKRPKAKTSDTSPLSSPRILLESLLRRYPFVLF